MYRYLAQDIDLTCCQMCAINMVYANMEGTVVWGDTLTLKVNAAWHVRPIKKYFAWPIVAFTEEELKSTSLA